MKIDKAADEFINVLKSSGYFEGIKIIKSFAQGIKPTILEYPVIAVSVKSAEFENISVGDCNYYGEAVIAFDIYAPLSSGSAAVYETAQNIFYSCADYDVVSFCVSQIQRDTQNSCIKMNCTITVKTAADIGGEDD